MSSKNNISLRNPLCFIFGTRPEIIKLAPIIKECERTNTPFITIHTGQHYSDNMDRVFIKGLQLPRLNYNLHVGSGTHATQTARMIEGIESILLQQKPSYVIVQGDTNSVLAGALVASKLHIPIAHVEAGLRSYDRTMPEEINRILTGSVAHHHFAPTEKAKINLLKEGIDPTLVHVTGNTVVDAMYQNVTIAKDISTITQNHNLSQIPYALVTVHRPDNTDSKHNLQNILTALKEVSTKHSLTLVWPMHPRTQKQIELFELTDFIKNIPNLKLIEPVDFFDMLALQSNSTIVITDSGGLQEEACILQVPCVTLRNNTERPESVAVGANILAGNNPQRIINAVKTMLSKKRIWENPFGDGTASQKILAILNNDSHKKSVSQPETESIRL